MATFAQPVLGFATRPDDTGECWLEPSDIVYGSNDLARQFLLRLGSSNAAQPTVKHGIYGSFRIPKNYVGTAVLVIEWTATLTSGDVVFDYDYNAVGGDAAESFDPSAWQESVTVTDTVSGTARRKSNTTINLTSGNMAVDDTVQFFFGRDGVDAADTMAGAAWVADVVMLYNDV